MFAVNEAHQVSPDLGWIELWCAHCQQNTVHDFTIVTDNSVQQDRVGRYVDTNVVRSLRASCSGCERERDAFSA